jgi:hypothetical protein
MGYDFSFMVVAPRPQALPFHRSMDFDGRVEPLRDTAALERCLLSRGGFKLNGPPIRGAIGGRARVVDAFSYLRKP